MRMAGSRGAAIAAGTAAVVAVAVAPRHAAAQDALGFRYTLEAYAASYTLDDAIGTNKQNLGGFGARLTLNPREPDRPRATLADRAVGALFATYTAKQGSPDVSTLHVGAQTDASFLPRPLGGILDPFLSLGLGIFRTSRENLIAPGGKRITRSDLAFSPAVGTRIHLGRGIGARGDLRAPLVFGTATTANFVAEGGLFVSF